MKNLPSDLRTSVTRTGCGLALILGIGTFGLSACQDATNANQPSTANSTPPGAQTDIPNSLQPGGLDNPRWAQLTPARQAALAPLTAEWDKLEPLRKKKWLEIAEKYPKMPAVEQERIHARMREWVQLTPEQRRTARESYARAKKMNAEQKSARWDQYQQLPEEKKQQLAVEAENKKRLANLARLQAPKTTPLAATATHAAPPAPAVSSSAPVVPLAPADPASAPVMSTEPMSAPSPSLP